MVFLDELQAWLAAPTLEIGQAAPPPLPDDVDLTPLVREAWEATESIEGTADDVFSDWRVAVLTWTRAEVVSAWAALTIEAIRGHRGERVDPETEAHLLKCLLWKQIAGRPPQGSGRVSATLWRVAQQAHDEALEQMSLGPRLERNRAIRAFAEHHALIDAWGVVTPAGRALVQLRGRDAASLLVAIGIELSVGPQDPWRVGEAAWRALLDGKVSIETYDDHEGPFAIDPLWRLVSLGVVDALHGEHPMLTPTEFWVEPSSEPYLRPVVTDPDHRFRAFARALLEIQRGAAFEAFSDRPASEQIDAHFARSVAHELRNMLLPLRTNVNRLLRAHREATAPTGDLVDLTHRIEQAMERLGAFAEQTVMLASATAPEEISLAAVLADADHATIPDRNGRISVDLDVDTSIRIFGSRRDWVFAFTNLLRNAAQVRADAGTVWISAARQPDGSLQIAVDDDGPGVPEERRELIFGDGHSTTGGTGLGLVAARRAAHAVGGSLVCEASPRGGARFRFTLPARSVR